MVLLGSITQSGLTQVNTVVAALVVVFATVYGSINAVGIMSAGTALGEHRVDWDHGKKQFFGALVGLALCVLVGTAAFRLGGVGATF